MSSVIWKFLERISAQMVTMVVGIILARLLSPSHYGVIAIVNVFITICNTFVVTGLGESLVQKKNSDELDFSSVFYVNLLLSVTLYAILFFAAPAISDFYGGEYEDLALIIRIMGIRLIFAATNSIQSAAVSKQMAFKKYFFVTMIGTVISAIVGIGMAYKGYGVWALVAQYMTNTVVNTILLFFFIRWYPRLQFSLSRVKPLAYYGVKILSSAMLTTLYNESREFLIGKKYSAEDLAYYSKGGTYPKLIINNVNSALGSVLFPVFAQKQNDCVQLKSSLRRALKLTSYIVFPAVMGLGVVADDFVSVLLTDKWLPCVPYLRAMCLVYAVIPLSTLNLQCLCATGKSGENLKLNTKKKTIGLLLLMVSYGFGVKWIVVTFVASVMIDYILDTNMSFKNVQYGFWNQVKDILPQLLISVGMGAVVYVAKIFLSTRVSTLAGLCIRVVVGVVSYVLLSAITKNEAFIYFRNALKKTVAHR